MITPLEGACDPARFGGKAAGLARALSAGLPVPRGLAIEHAVLAEALARPDGLRGLAGAIAEALPGALAVRSSALDEDGGSASFAGQHCTRLYVCGAEQTERALRDVWASAQSAGAAAYRARLAIAAVPKMAIVAQCFVAAELAGVLFTRHPTTGADERVIEAARGLGEAVVQGSVSPDLYRLARGGRLLATHLGAQDFAVQARAGGGTEEVEVAPQRAPLLSQRWLSALDQLASACERTFGAGRDLEWAIADEQLFLLQCRSVTR